MNLACDMPMGLRPHELIPHYNLTKLKCSQQLFGYRAADKLPAAGPSDLQGGVCRHVSSNCLSQMPVWLQPESLPGPALP